eukprot:scaffold24422_cov112-Isochrysis_galbana.AAC.6
MSRHPSSKFHAPRFRTRTSGVLAMAFASTVPSIGNRSKGRHSGNLSPRLQRMKRISATRAPGRESRRATLHANVMKGLFTPQPAQSAIGSRVRRPVGGRSSPPRSRRSLACPGRDSGVGLRTFGTGVPQRPRRQKGRWRCLPRPATRKRRAPPPTRAAVLPPPMRSRASCTGPT